MEMNGAQGIVIRTADATDAAAWDRFVDTRPHASFFHRFGWSQVIEASFGHRAYYLLATRASEIAGILPLAHKSSPLFGNALVSLPFLSYGGIVADDPDCARALEDQAVLIANQLGVDYIEFRNTEARRDDWLRPDNAYATFLRDIPPGRDAIIKAVPAKGRRHALRKSLGQGLEFEIQDNLDDFYSVISESYRNLGTPIFPKQYFARLLATFPEEFEVNIVRGPSGPVAAALVFAFRDHLHPYYAGGTTAARPLHANDFLFLSIMCRALDRGYPRFDFGRSKVGTGSFAYKTYWGFDPQPLSYEYKLVRGKTLPDMTPLNPRYRPFVNLWKHLPLPVSRLVGPHIVRHLG